jgi:hypothetical protein
MDRDAEQKASEGIVVDAETDISIANEISNVERDALGLKKPIEVIPEVKPEDKDETPKIVKHPCEKCQKHEHEDLLSFLDTRFGYKVVLCGECFKEFNTLVHEDYTRHYKKFTDRWATAHKKFVERYEKKEVKMFKKFKKGKLKRKNEMDPHPDGCMKILYILGAALALFIGIGVYYVETKPKKSVNTIEDTSIEQSSSTDPNTTNYFNVEKKQNIMNKKEILFKLVENNPNNLELKSIANNILDLMDKDYDNYLHWDRISSKTKTLLTNNGFLFSKGEDRGAIQISW